MTWLHRTLAFLRVAGWRTDEFSVLIKAEDKFFVRFRLLWRSPKGVLPTRALAALHDEVVAVASRILNEFQHLGADSVAIKIREAFAPRDVGVWVTPTADRNKPRLEAELLRLEFLRDHVFSDAALGRIWWMSQAPNSVRAVGEQIFLDTLRESQGADPTDTSVANAKMLPILIEFVTWLGSGDHRAELALKVLDHTFATLALTDLQEQLQDVRTQNSSPKDRS